MNDKRYFVIEVPIDAATDAHFLGAVFDLMKLKNIREVPLYELDQGCVNEIMGYMLEDDEAMERYKANMTYDQAVARADAILGNPSWLKDETVVAGRLDDSAT